ncbi:hypothetical protein ACQCX2_04985 [Propionibacteriaceae bacterium Y1700]|uniref:hypothetical protein n=1 Tax=Microlunatus sp. Y1700 TaxID=3418487 RepID=UPI003DA778EC
MTYEMRVSTSALRQLAVQISDIGTRLQALTSGMDETLTGHGDFGFGTPACTASLEPSTDTAVAEVQIFFRNTAAMYTETANAVQRAARAFDETESVNEQLAQQILLGELDSAQGRYLPPAGQEDQSDNTAPNPLATALNGNPVSTESGMGQLPKPRANPTKPMVTLPNGQRITPQQTGGLPKVLTDKNGGIR